MNNKIGLAIGVAMLASPLTAQTSKAPPPVFVPAPPPPPLPAPTVLPAGQQASEATALQFAQAYQPAAFVTEVAVGSAVASFRGASAQRAETADIERQYPGAGRRMEEALARAVTAVYARELPKSQQAIADFARQYLTETEMTAVTEFYRSPAGGATLRAVMSTADIQKIGNPTDANGDPKLTGKDLTNALSGPSFLGKMSAADVSSLSRFSTSPAGRKLMRISPMLAEVVARQTNEIVINGRGDVDEAMMLTAREIMAGKPKK